MGYSKYKEDIEKIRSLNIFGTFLDFQPQPAVPIHRCPFCPFETQVKDQFEAHVFAKHRDMAIYLEHDGHIVPERASFSVRPVRLKVRCLALADGVECSVQPNQRKQTSRHFRDGQLLSITPPDEETVVVTLSVAAYRREYGITFKRRILTAPLTQRLVDLIDVANNEIARWDWARMEAFKAELASEPGLGEVGSRHRLAIWEYYFGLFLEQQGKPEYAHHLEGAFEVLRDFDEPLAHLITNYFLYRVNLFESIPSRLPFPRLRQMASFFAGTSPVQSGAVSKLTDVVPCEIAISDVDSAIFSGVEALREGNFSHALRFADAASQKRKGSDDQALSRLMFLRFSISREAGRIEEARGLATRLSVSGVAPFRREAESFLKAH